ncbi:hypothetical protein [Cellulomonas xylanilytica]|uniref:Extradiol ring-cleavage dioxygenase class III enzyme subunit B domain-containing protein n=1 Tax=Cellulomonas xylanilytica TaxID=233583 RepID=A0A510V1C3_9CELL|nr:hypothetical protein [Cellulomonas xylanilytica]GEK20658.1 hypothetical protein CXY01_11780 [Cellulomonas xylanilytica]
MLVVAALVPDTALLVPGVAGGAEVLVDVRDAAVAAVADVVAADVEAIVVVAPGPVPRELRGTVRPSLAAAGVPDGLVGWAADAVTLPGEGVDVPSVPSAVGLHLLLQAGRRRSLRVVEVTGHQGVATLAALGRALVDDGPTGLVVVGSGSARHGPDAPLADDPRAPDHDARVLADLADAGTEARARLAADDGELADALAVRGWAPWQVLLGATGERPVRARLLAQSTELGAQHAVLVWDAR